jgi:hypothetical protein
MYLQMKSGTEDMIMIALFRIVMGNWLIGCFIALKDTSENSPVMACHCQQSFVKAPLVGDPRITVDKALQVAIGHQNKSLLAHNYNYYFCITIQSSFCKPDLSLANVELGMSPQMNLGG